MQARAETVKSAFQSDSWAWIWSLMLSYFASYEIKDPVLSQSSEEDDHAGHVSLWVEKTWPIPCRKGPLHHSVLQSQLTHPAWTKNHRELKLLLTLASGQVELLQRQECLSGPKHPGVGGSDLSAHSSAPSSAAAELATLLGGSWDSGLGSKPTYSFKDMYTVVKPFVCLHI